MADLRVVDADLNFYENEGLFQIEVGTDEGDSTEFNLTVKQAKMLVAVVKDWIDSVC